MGNSYLDKIGLNALNASKDLSLLNEKKKNKVLTYFYKNLKSNKKKILKANKIDVSKANKKGLSQNIINRLTLNDNKINYIIKSIQEVIKLKDPTKKIISKWKRPNGMIINSTQFLLVLLELYMNLDQTLRQMLQLYVLNLVMRLF